MNEFRIAFIVADIVPDLILFEFDVAIFGTRCVIPVPRAIVAPPHTDDTGTGADVGAGAGCEAKVALVFQLLVQVIIAKNTKMQHMNPNAIPEMIQGI
ncbi:hypothetical protein HDU76_010314, partial [Blyttiomyces sp. JEL0837]